MASESSSSNVLLVGQKAYVKKNGSMTNNGIIIKDSLNTNNTYSNYIAEGSKVKAAKVEDTTEYINCKNSMKSSLSNDFIESEELDILETANNMIDILEPKCNKIQNIIDNINMFKTTKCISNEPLIANIDLNIPLDSTISIYISPNTTESEYDILVSENFKLHLINNTLYINNISLNTYGGNIVLLRKDNIFYINKYAIETECLNTNFILFPEENNGFIGQLGEIKIYDEDSTIHKIIPVNKLNIGSGLYDEETNIFYDIPVYLFKIYEKANIYSKPMYLNDIYIDGDTGIEVKFSNYSSGTTSDTYIYACAASDTSIGNRLDYSLRRAKTQFTFSWNKNQYSSVSTNLDCSKGPTDVITSYMNVLNDGKMRFSGAVNGSFNLTQIDSSYKCPIPFGFPGNTSPIDTDKSNMVNDTYYYYIKIYNDNTLIRHLLMAQTIDGVNCLYDDITKKIYSKGKSSFSCSGSVIDWR